MSRTLKQQTADIIGSDPGTNGYPDDNAVAGYFISGQWDVIHKALSAYPESAYKFVKEVTQNSGSGAGFAGIEMPGDGTVSSAVYTPDKDAGTPTWSGMREMNPHEAKQSENAGSLYATMANSPGYYVSGGKLYGLPSAADGKVAQIIVQLLGINEAVDNTTVGTYINLNGDTDSSSGTAQFPSEWSHSVVLYVAMKCFLYKMATQKATSISTNLPTPPGSVTLDKTALTLPQIQDLPSFAPPALDLETDVDLSTLTVPSYEEVPVPAEPSFTGGTTTLPTDVPKFEAPIVAPDFAEAELKLDDEDVELVDSKMKIIAGELQNYKLNLDNAQADFASRSAEYSAGVKKALQDAQSSLAREKSEYDAVVKKYQTQVGSSLQKYEKKIAAYVQEASIKIKEYTAKSGVDLKSFEDAIAVEAQRVKNELAKATGTFQQDIAKYKTELQRIM